MEKVSASPRPPRVSVLIPTYNCAHFLGQALDSVLAQTYQDFEIIVVDDGSTDDTAQVMALYPQVRYFQREHSGISATRNAAIAAAAGQIITFLDADDLWLPQKLELQVAYLDAHPECMLVFTQAANFYDDEHGTKNRRQQELHDANMDHYIISAAIRREVFDLHGDFRTDYAYGEDTQLLFRLRVLGIHLDHCLPLVLYRRRIHSTNISLEHTATGNKQIMSITADAIRQVKQGSKE